MEHLEGIASAEPFPHFIIKSFYYEEELDLIWEELNFYTKPGKFLPPKDYGGIEGFTDAKALCLDSEYIHRNISNILTVNRKIFDNQILEPFIKIHDCCGEAGSSNYDITKVRYYHNGEYYEPHVDASMRFLIFTYFNIQPNKSTI